MGMSIRGCISVYVCILYWCMHACVVCDCVYVPGNSYTHPVLVGIYALTKSSTH